MWLILLLISALYFQGLEGLAKPNVECTRDFTKLGCFKTNSKGVDRVGFQEMKMILNDQDVNSEHHDGYRIEYGDKFKASIHSLACRCSAKAKQYGYTYFSIRYWAECWIGKDFAKVEQFLMSPDWRSPECHNHLFTSCNDDSDIECVGQEETDYIYQIKSNNTDGGFSDWTEWSKCTASCGLNHKQERERTCTNPLTKGNGKACSGEYSETRNCILPNCPSNCPKLAGDYGHSTLTVTGDTIRGTWKNGGRVDFHGKFTSGCKGTMTFPDDRIFAIDYDNSKCSLNYFTKTTGKRVWVKENCGSCPKLAGDYGHSTLTVTGDTIRGTWKNGGRVDFHGKFTSGCKGTMKFPDDTNNFDIDYDNSKCSLNYFIKATGVKRVWAKKNCA
jgi:hypothetical protein